MSCNTRQERESCVPQDHKGAGGMLYSHPGLKCVEPRRNGLQRGFLLEPGLPRHTCTEFNLPTSGSTCKCTKCHAMPSCPTPNLPPAGSTLKVSHAGALTALSLFWTVPPGSLTYGFQPPCRTCRISPRSYSDSVPSNLPPQNSDNWVRRTRDIDDPKQKRTPLRPKIGAALKRISRQPNQSSSSQSSRAAAQFVYRSLQQWQSSVCT